MAFVKEASWAILPREGAMPKPPLKVKVLSMVESFMKQNGIETQREYGPLGVYKVDLIEKMGEEMKDIPDERILSSLKELISQSTILVGAYA